MHERLQKKIDELKKGRDPEDFHPLMCFDAHPPKFEVELPKHYQQNTAQLLEFIEQRDLVAKELPNLLPADIPKARAALSELTRAIDDMEEILEKDYLELQKEQREDQELYEATYLQNQISEEHFIMVKHLKPHIFEKFKKWVFKYATEEEIEQQLAIIARREAEELEPILDGDIQPPEFVNPHIKRLSPFDLFARQMNDISMIAFETDDYFREHYEIINNGHKNRTDFAMRMYRSLPVTRARLDQTIRQIEPALRRATQLLNQYFNENRASGKFTEIENPDQKKLDECFESLDRYEIEVFIAHKHLRPEIFPGFEKIVLEGLTAEETKEFYARVAECEEKSLKTILKAVANEIH